MGSSSTTYEAEKGHPNSKTTKRKSNNKLLTRKRGDGDTKIFGNGLVCFRGTKSVSFSLFLSLLLKTKSFADEKVLLCILDRDFKKKVNADVTAAVFLFLLHSTRSHQWQKKLKDFLFRLNLKESFFFFFRNTT